MRVKKEITQKLPNLRLILKEGTDSWKKPRDVETIAQNEQDISEKLNQIRNDFMRYVQTNHYITHKEYFVICLILIHLLNYISG